MRALLLPLSLLLVTSTYAQPDSTGAATRRTWLGAVPHDGRMSHQLPPPSNLVTAGDFLHYSGEAQRTAWLVRLATVGVGYALSFNNEDVGKGLAIGGLLLSVHWDLRSARFTRNAGVLLQSGYTVTERYELVPDSVNMDRPSRMVPKNWRP